MEGPSLPSGLGTFYGETADDSSASDAMANHFDDHPLGHRDLENGIEFEDMSNLTMLEVIQTSFRLYGSIFAALFFVFVLGRRYYRAAYNVLDASEETRTPLSGDRYFGGWISFVWLVFRPSDDELFEHCGMDAAVFIRTLRYGMKVALVGVFNSVYLIPVYLYSGGDYTQLESITLGNVPEGSNSLLAATFACYVTFGSAMYLLYREFGWFTARRHRFLARARPDNYTAYVRNIPPEYCSDDALMEYFRTVFSHESVVDARVAIDAPNLEKLVAEREDVSNRLEHAINVLRVKGVRPTHRKIHTKRRGCRPPKGELVDSIDAYADKLRRLNDEIGNRMDEIARGRSPGGPLFAGDLEAALMESEAYRGAQRQRATLAAEAASALLAASQAGSAADGAGGASMANGEASLAAATAGGNSTVLEFDEKAGLGGYGALEAPSAAQDALVSKPEGKGFQNEEEQSIDESTAGGSSWTKSSKESKKVGQSLANFNPVKASAGLVKGSAGLVAGSAGLVAGVAATTTKGAMRGVGGAAEFAATRAADATKLASDLVLGGEDGHVRDAGFVSFSTLKAKNSAVQMLHHEAPFTMQVMDAPLPQNIFWWNVGLSHKAQQIGTVVAFALTVLLCVFWTIPVTFFTALGDVENLTQTFPFLEDWLEKAPWLSMFLSQLKPLLLVIIVAMLPPILTAFSKREGHISEAMLSSSLFGKLSIFLLVQIFFVQMISGTILEEIENMIRNPSYIITLLAEALPKQAQSFISYVIVQTFMNLGTEITRFVPILCAWIRKKFGPNLTEKERRTPWMGLSPICVPPEFDFADVQANLILYYMILFVYSILSPITAYVMGGAFLLFSLCYRHQLLFVYSTENDTGGLLFVRFAKLVMACIIVAEITMFGVLLLKLSPIAAPAVIPLIVLTVLFNMYLGQQHYKVTEYLPSIACVHTDIRNIGELDAADLTKGEYLQPAFQTRYLQPDNMSALMGSESKPESMRFFTPNHSTIEEEDDEPDEEI